MDKLYRKVKCPDCEWSQFSGCIDTVGMTPCYRCQSTGFIFVPVDYTELQSAGEAKGEDKVIERMVIERMARVGYNTMHEEDWDEPTLCKAVRVMWLGIAENMLTELRRA